jgi:hypothetical protein
MVKDIFLCFPNVNFTSGLALFLAAHCSGSPKTFVNVTYGSASKLARLEVLDQVTIRDAFPVYKCKTKTVYQVKISKKEQLKCNQTFLCHYTGCSATDVSSGNKCSCGKFGSNSSNKHMFQSYIRQKKHVFSQITTRKRVVHT